MYFALGEMARTDRRADFREVRKQMDGLQLTLTHSTAKNNAFIMCIGEHVIVEFGEKGNACFIFRRNEIPFALAGEVAGNSLALKGTRGRLERLTHMDGSERWEDKFRKVLANVVRVRPPSGKHGPTSTGSWLRPTVPSQAAPSIGAPQTPAAQDSHSDRWQPKPQHALPVPPTTKFTMTEFATFCESHQLRIADNREKGGNLWVDHTYPSTDVAAQLSAWGFHFKPTAGWWFK
jgi:hypothetical protein